MWLVEVVEEGVGADWRQGKVEWGVVVALSEDFFFGWDGGRFDDVGAEGVFDV